MVQQEQKSPAEQESKQQPKQKKVRRKRKQSIGERILFFSAKWLFIFFCLFISVIAGLVFGYSIIGDGEASEVFDLRMWKHIYDLVFTIN